MDIFDVDNILTAGKQALHCTVKFMPFSMTYRKCFLNFQQWNAFLCDISGSLATEIQVAACTGK